MGKILINQERFCYVVTSNDRSLDLTQGYPDVQRVFLNVQRASQNNHLPAFQRCAERGTAQSHQGRGGRRGQGRGFRHRRGSCSDSLPA